MAAELRATILNGSYQAGARLPTRIELAEQFQTTPVRVQKALDLLDKEGLICSRGCLGTFVSETFPVKRPYALTFPLSVGALNSHFYRTILSVAEKRTGQSSLEVFHGIDARLDEPDYLRLTEMVKNHSVAGIIFAAFPRALGDSSIVRETSMPRVLIQGGRTAIGIPSVYPDMDALLTQAIQYLAGRGRRRLAVVSLVNSYGDLPPVEKMQKLASKFGMMLRPEWLQGVHSDALPWGEQVGRILFGMGRNQRPDALVISDDNLVPSVTAGIMLSGIRVPQDLEIVAHANFPQPTPSAVPAARLGFDISSLLEMCLDRIDQQCRGEVPVPSTALQAVFEDELGLGQDQSITRKISIKDGGHETDRPTQKDLVLT